MEHTTFVSEVRKGWVVIKLGRVFSIRTFLSLWNSTTHRYISRRISICIVLIWICSLLIVTSLPVLVLLGWMESILMMLAGVSLARMARNAAVRLLSREALIDSDFFEFALQQNLLTTCGSEIDWKIRKLFWSLVFGVPLVFALFVGVMLLIGYIAAPLVPFDIEAVIVVLLLLFAFIDSHRGADRYGLFK